VLYRIKQNTEASREDVIAWISQNNAAYLHRLFNHWKINSALLNKPMKVILTILLDAFNFLQLLFLA